MTTLTRFTVPLNPEPDDNFYDRRDAAAEDEAKIRRDDEVQSSSDRDLKQALAYAKPFNGMLEQIFQRQTGDKPPTEGKI